MKRQGRCDILTTSIWRIENPDCLLARGSPLQRSTGTLTTSKLVVNSFSLTHFVQQLWHPKLGHRFVVGIRIDGMVVRLIMYNIRFILQVMWLSSCVWFVLMLEDSTLDIQRLRKSMWGDIVSECFLRDVVEAQFCDWSISRIVLSCRKTYLCWAKNLILSALFCLFA